MGTKAENMRKLNNNVKKTLRKLLSHFNVKVSLDKPSVVGVKSVKEEKENIAEDTVNVQHKKKKKKNKKKSSEMMKEKKERKIEAVAAEDAASIPSFKGLLVDTTQVFKNEAKKEKEQEEEKFRIFVNCRQK